MTQVNDTGLPAPNYNPANPPPPQPCAEEVPLGEAPELPIEEAKEEADEEEEG